jgi:flagellar assembly factor FliW
MRITGTRFGEIELEDNKAIVFPRGLIGFPDAKRYVLLQPSAPGRVAWLQSIDTPELAFPVIDGGKFGGTYPDPTPAKLAHEAGLGEAELAVLVVVAADKSKKLVANMLAPLVVDMASRSGAQVVLDPKQYSAAAPLS